MILSLSAQKKILVIITLLIQTYIHKQTETIVPHKHAEAAYSLVCFRPPPPPVNEEKRARRKIPFL